MQSTNQPGKFLIPFAQNDGAKVEIPPTTTDATRFSQSLGSPPLTGMPPEAGGVPPQLEDFNGALNQQSRVAWWMFSGNRFGFDATWAADPLINGYARGAVLPAALGAGLIGLGEWYSNAEDNVANPDTVGTGWVPGYHYGATALTGQAGGTVTLSPAQAAKRVITIAGTLTSNLVLVVPGWVYDWTVYNNTGGAFTVTVKNAATPGVVIPQNGGPTPIRCDGTSCFGWNPNLTPAVADTQAAQFGQVNPGRLLNVQRITASGTYTPTAGTSRIVVEVVGGGGAGGGAASTASGQVAVGGGGGAGAYVKALISSVPSSVAVTIAAAVAGTNGNGGAGNTTTFGAYASAPGGSGGPTRASATAPAAFLTLGAAGASAPTVGAGATTIIATPGAPGTPGLGTEAGVFVAGGYGGGTPLGHAQGAASRDAPANSGAGGGGAGLVAPAAAQAGGTGAAGCVVVWEYA